MLGKRVWGGHYFFYLLSYFALISLHTNFHDPRTIPSGRKVCVGGWVVGGGVEGNFSVSFGPKPGLGFGFKLGLGPS